MPATPRLLGIEIGGTKLQLGLGAGDGTIVALERRVIEPALGARGILAQVSEAFGPLLAGAGLAPGGGAIDAAGVGFGGPVDAGRGVATRSHQVEGWAGLPIADWLRTSLGVRLVALGNDADVAALAESRFGSGRGRSPVLYVTVGSGVGGGLIVNGRIYRGAGAGAVEVGHLRVPPDGPTSDADADESDWPTVERQASGWGLTGAARRLVGRGGCGPDWPVLLRAGGDPARITTRLVAEAARDGDVAARRVLRRGAEALAFGLGQAVTLLAPARIVIGGGVSLIDDDLWLDPLRRRLDALTFPPFLGTFDVVRAALGEGVVVQGALALARDLIDHDPV